MTRIREHAIREGGPVRRSFPGRQRSHKPLTWPRRDKPAMKPRLNIEPRDPVYARRSSRAVPRPPTEAAKCSARLLFSIDANPVHTLVANDTKQSRPMESPQRSSLHGTPCRDARLSGWLPEDAAVLTAFTRSVCGTPDLEPLASGPGEIGLAVPDDQKSTRSPNWMDLGMLHCWKT